MTFEKKDGCFPDGISFALFIEQFCQVGFAIEKQVRSAFSFSEVTVQSGTYCFPW